MSAFPLFLRIRIEEEGSKPLRLLIPMLLFLPFLYIFMILGIALYFLGSLVCLGNAWRRPGHIVLEPFRFVSAFFGTRVDVTSAKGRTEIYFQ